MTMPSCPVRTTRGRLAGALALTAALTAPAIAALAGPAADMTGRAPPNCVLTLSQGGRQVELDQFRGKVVYVDFWASWCGPCLVSFPFMDRMDRDLRGRGLQLIAVDMDSRPEAATRFLATHPVGFSVALKGGEACARGFGVAGMPSSYLIDRKGIIRAVRTGFRPGEGERIRAMVEQTLAEKAP